MFRFSLSFPRFKLNTVGLPAVDTNSRQKVLEKKSNLPKMSQVHQKARDEWQTFEQMIASISKTKSNYFLHTFNGSNRLYIGECSTVKKDINLHARNEH